MLPTPVLRTRYALEMGLALHGLKSNRPPQPAVFPVGTLTAPPSSASEESNSELEADSMCTDAATLDPASLIYSSTLEDDF